MKSFKLFAIFLFPLALLAESPYQTRRLFAIESPTWLLTTPRSGSHWLSYAISYLSGHRVMFTPTADKTPLPVDEQKSSIWSGHSLIQPLTKELASGHKLVVLVRNHLDSLIRNFGTYEKVVDFLIKSNEYKCGNPNFYYPLTRLNDKKIPRHIKTLGFIFEQLSMYEQWPYEDKLLVYYEEFILSPETTLRKIMHFLGETNWPIREFIEEIETHSSKSKNYYLSRPYGYCRSNGRDIHPYSQDLSAKQIEYINDPLEELDPNLFCKYLKNCPFNINAEKLEFLLCQ